MATEDEVSYACRCLNIKLRRGAGSGSNDEQLSAGASQEFKPLFVGDAGIQVMHNALTLRIRSSVVVDSDGRHTQFIAIRCLVCETLTYRVKAEITPDSDAKEGPVMPSDDWTEKETLVSRQGWVFVHVGTEGCIEAEEIKRKSSSNDLSAQFSIVLPGHAHQEHAQNLPSEATYKTIPSTHNFLPGLGPFLPPPPFTSSHPIFTHLASIAAEHSRAARDMSAKRIEDFTKRQMAELDEAETRLRSELERIWVEVRQNLKKAEKERVSSSSVRRNSMSPETGSRALSPSILNVGSPRVSNFAPVPNVAASRPFSPTNRTSALSASLRTSNFHHSRGHQHTSETREIETPSPPPYTSNPSSSVGSSGSITNGGMDIARPTHRKMDQSIDAAATYQFFAIEEQEALRRKKNEAAKGADVQVKASDAPKIDLTKLSAKEKSQAATEQAIPQETKNHNEESGREDSRKRDGKRKVTFNVQPDVVRIKRETKTENESLPEHADDLLFEYDNDLKDTANEVADPDDNVKHDMDQRTILPLREVEGEPRAIKKSRPRPLRDLSEGLPQSFIALRPISLPAPSHVRPPIRPREGRNEIDASVASSSGLKNVPSRGSNQSELALSPMQQEVQKRVGGDMPSHRGAWNAGSESWKIFQSNDSDKTDEESDNDTESTVTQSRSEFLTSLYAIPGSLPTPMPSKTASQFSSTTSLQPKTSLTDRLGTLVPPLMTISEEGESDNNGSKRSAVARRKEIYAERDRIRGMDPGMLDFADTGVDDSEDADVDDYSVSRSRQHALNIIKARNSVPAEGFWRSLA